MNWKIKALIAMIISILPFKSKIYKKVQQIFGRYEYDAIETLSQALMNTSHISMNKTELKIFE